MRYLLDTHVLIWHAENQNLSQNVLNIINNPENTIRINSVFYLLISKIMKSYPNCLFIIKTLLTEC